MLDNEKHFVICVKLLLLFWPKCLEMTGHFGSCLLKNWRTLAAAAALLVLELLWQHFLSHFCKWGSFMEEHNSIKLLPPFASFWKRRNVAKQAPLLKRLETTILLPILSTLLWTTKIKETYLQLLVKSKTKLVEHCWREAKGHRHMHIPGSQTRPESWQAWTSLRSLQWQLQSSSLYICK